MSLTPLLSHLSGLSPQARYALMKLWLESGDSFPLQLSVQECALKLAMPRARAGKVINELIDKGHIEPDYGFGQRGRPKRFIDISAATRGMLSKLTPTQTGEVPHLESVHRLLNHRTSDTASGSPSLSPANLVFLIALLSCANESGAVYDLGTSKLAAYTGMETQRINLQIGKMLKLGVLISTVPGVTNGRIMGRTTTNYWLNLNHHLLKTPDLPILVRKHLLTLDSGNIVSVIFELTRQLKVERRKYTARLGRQLNNQQVAHLASRLPNAHHIKRIPKIDISLVENFFDETLNPGLELAVQSMVDRIACDNALARISAETINRKISLTTTTLRYLYQKLLPLNFQRGEGTNFPTRENKQMLMRLVLGLASTLADELIKLIGNLGLEIDEGALLQLAPTHRKLSTDRYLIVATRSLDKKSTSKEKSTADTS